MSSEALFQRELLRLSPLSILALAFPSLSFLHKVFCGLFVVGFFGVAMPKKRIRRSQIMQREDLTVSQRADLSRRAQLQVVEQEWFVASKLIALYSPIRNEVETQLICNEALASGKRVAYPRIDGGCMVFIEVAAQHDLNLGAFGVLEPRGTVVVPVDLIDVIIVPGVAFDRNGFRIGFGKGYYDRALENRPLSCRLAGLAYAFQVEDCIPNELHDVRLDELVTDQEILHFDRGVNL